LIPFTEKTKITLQYPATAWFDMVYSLSARRYGVLQVDNYHIELS